MILLSQFPDFHALTALSMVGSCMPLVYASIAFVSILVRRPCASGTGPSVSLRHGAPPPPAAASAAPPARPRTAPAVVQVKGQAPDVSYAIIDKGSTVSTVMNIFSGGWGRR